MEALYIQPYEEKMLIQGEQDQGESGAQEEEGMDASDVETDEDSEPEPPLVIRRKVSFADAFGLNLVSVKEFDNVEATEPEVSKAFESEATHSLEEFYMTCLFTVPSCSDELDQRLQAQMVELESIELLPGTSTLRGILRVVNLCYSKSVYIRMTLDRWTSYFDLLAEYIPGSSDRKTDRFTFKYTLIPPFEKEGTRVEFCLRYETSEGTFWANNNHMNYVLFCHQRGHAQEQGPQVQEESSSYRSKRSCLKANRRGSTQEKALETSYTSTVIAEGEAHKAWEAEITTKDRAEIKSALYHMEHRPLVDSIKSRHKAARLVRVQERLAQRRIPQACSHDSTKGQETSQPTPWVNPASLLQKNQTLHVLTYHQIPLLTLDWNNDKIHPWGSTDMDDIWTGRAKVSAENIEDVPCDSDTWQSFRNGTDDTADKGSSVCDVWQAFLNGTSCADHSGVPESEWLQTATSVSPSNDKEPKAGASLSSQRHEFQAATDQSTYLNSHTSVAHQPLSDSQTLLSFTTLKTEDHQTAEACVSSPRNDNTAAENASQRSQTNSVTDTPKEFSPKGVMTVSEGSVDGSTECHEHVMWERERGGIIERAEGIGRDAPLAEHAADFVTSSGESETTGLTETPESQNASAVDRISQGASLDVGLSSDRESEVTGTAHNAMDDTLAFGETIKQGTKDGERFVFPTSRHGEEKGIMNNCTANRVSTQEEVFRPQKTDGCEISQRYADEKHREEFRLNQNRENPLLEDEIRPAEFHLDGLEPRSVCEDDIRESQMRAREFKLESKKTEVQNSCATSGKTKRRMYADKESIKVLNEESCQHNDNAVQETRLIQAREDVCNHENVGLKSESGESAQTAERRDMLKPVQYDRDALRTFPDKCNQNAAEVLETKWNHLQDDMKGPREDIGNETRAQEATIKETTAKADNPTELQHQPELLEIIEEDMSQRGKDKRGSIEKLKIEVQGELMSNVENPRRERKNAPAELEEQELSAEVEGFPLVECGKLSEGTKEPVQVEMTETLEVMELQLEEMFVERFGEDLVKRIWEEVFGQDDTNIRKELRGKPENTPKCNLSGEGSNDDFDSGVFSLIELPTHPEPFSKSTDQPLVIADNLLPSQTDSSGHLSQDTSPDESWQSWTEPAQSSLKYHDNYSQIKERSAIWRDAFKQTEDWEVTHKESFGQPGHLSYRVQSSSSEKFRSSDCLVWWNILYILFHITRLVVCVVLVAGFFFVVFLYDFPAFFALYVFSMCCWFSQWRRHRVATNKGMVG
ncbi:uncharacterized protein ppp1r3aa [Cheilinus undulatus]|uniref:uncharacterized protein ppp1r3aa n=1 Tax=Cheilinus undulatus TaxID=241271 RepID=UPI001BD6C819|nr:uncharacterized protein ppp1r3aa [Cheilinus undulatus]